MKKRAEKTKAKPAKPEPAKSAPVRKPSAAFLTDDPLHNLLRGAHASKICR
jgi:hypothetical protein